MSKEKQILHMLQDGYSQRCIASTLRVSRNTVAKVVKAASDHQLSKDALESREEGEIHHTLLPEEAMSPTLVTPDFPYIHKELLKSGVTLKLLWQEYVDRFLKWASGIGEATYKVIQGIFDSYRIEEQAYKGCLSLLKLADKYTPERLEYACKAALERIPRQRYKNIRLILESGNDKAADPSNQSFKSIHDENYALVRGASYYGGGRHEK